MLRVLTAIAIIASATITATLIGGRSSGRSGRRGWYPEDSPDAETQGGQDDSYNRYSAHLLFGIVASENAPVEAINNACTKAFPAGKQCVKENFPAGKVSLVPKKRKHKHDSDGPGQNSNTISS